MRHLLRRRPSAAMVIAVIALVVAASGTAVAATNLVSGDSLIKKNSLSGNRLRNHTVTGKQIKLSSLGTVPSATHATTANSATSATTATTAGAAPIASLTYVTTNVAVDDSMVTQEPPPTLGTATCPAGTFVTGGGASIADSTNGTVAESYPAGKTGWTGGFFDFNGPTTGTVTAICAPAAATAP